MTGGQIAVAVIVGGLLLALLMFILWVALTFHFRRIPRRLGSEEARAMRLTDRIVVYNATRNDSVKHLWPLGRAHVALCGDALQPWGEMKRVEGFALDRESPAASCVGCLIAHAAMLANLGHANQYDLDGKLHIEHVHRVAEAAQTPDEPLVVVVALLHDLPEDSSISFTRLREEHFPSVVIEAVWMLSRDKGEDYMTTYLGRIGSETAGPEGRLARRVKLADALDNLRRSQASGDEKRIAKYRRVVDQVGRAMRTHNEITVEAFDAVLA